MISCGPDVELEPKGIEDNIGREFAFQEESLLTINDKNILNTVCKSLRSKENLFKSNYVGSSAKALFSVQSTDCKDDDNGSGNVELAVIANGSELSFSNSSSTTSTVRYLANILSSSSGEMESFCNDSFSGEANINRFVKQSNMATVIELFPSNNVKCNRTSVSEMCVYITTGFKNESNDRYTTKTAEKVVIDVGVNASKTGIVISREKSSSLFCDEGSSKIVQVYTGSKL